MELKIYSKEGNLKLTASPDSNSAATCGIQEESVLSLSFTAFECVTLEVYDYADFLGRRYWILERYQPKMNCDSEWSYSVQLSGVEGLTTQVLMVNPDDDDNPILTLTAPAREHAALIIANMNRKMGTTEWKVGEVVVSEYIDIEYTGKYASDALSELSSAAGTEWWFDGMTLNISRCEFGEPVPLSYGNGLIGGIERSMADGVKFFTRLFPVGSTRNIDPDRYGHARLQLPDGAKYVEQDTHLGIIEYFEQEAFDAIYPRRIGTVGSVRSEERTSDDGSPFTVWYFTDPDIPFDPNQYEIGGLVKRVTFQTGELRGREFEVNYDSEKKEFEIITQWPYDNDMQLPSEPLVPAPGNEYVLWNISMPDSYYPAAEQEFKTAVDTFMSDSRKDISVFQASTDFTVVDKRNLDLKPGQRIRLGSDKFFPDGGYRDIRIVAISRSVVQPGNMTLKMSDVLSTGRISRIENQISEVTQITRQVSSEFPDIIKSWEETPASDTTLYSSRKSEREFLNKRRGGTVEGITRFLKRQQLDEGFRTSDFASGITGFGAQIDGRGAGELESLFIRRFLEVPELRKNRVGISVGDDWSAPGAGVIESVDKEQKLVTLKLEEGEIGAVAVEDICMGIFHDFDPSNNATADSDDGRGNRTFAGFATVYFRITEVLGDRNERFRYELRPLSATFTKQIDPMESMTFVAYGSFTNPARQSSRYSTRTYQRYLRNVSDWEFTAENIAAQFGDLTNLSVFGIQMSGYSAYLDNIYLQGMISSLDKKALLDTRSKLFRLVGDNGVGVAFTPEAGWKQGKLYDPATGQFQKEFDIEQIDQTAREAAQAAATAQQDANATAADVSSLKNFTDEAFADGVISRAEASSIEKYTNSVEETQKSADASYTTVYNNSLLSGTAKSNLQAAKSTFDTAVADLLSAIRTASDDGIATPEEKAGVDSQYALFNDAYSAFCTRLEEANEYIQTAINTAAQGAYQLSQELQGVVNNINETILPDLQDQIDKSIISWGGEEVPTLDNYPASEWTTDTERKRHINDGYDRKITTDGQVSYESYKFVFENGVYQWNRIADSGSATALAEARKALGLAGTKARVFYGSATPSVPYEVNDVWFRTSGSGSSLTTTLYISNADKGDGETASADDWQLVDDSQVRLRQMSSDQVISREEKAVLRNTLAQMQKEFATYQSDADTYGISITALSTAYNSLVNFLTGTVAVNNDTDTTLTQSQRTDYNTRFAAYTSEVARFSNLIADAISQGKVDGLQFGARNYIAKVYISDWNNNSQGKTDIVLTGSDTDGSYQSVNYRAVQEIISFGDSTRADIFRGRIKFQENMQYSFKVRWKLLYEMSSTVRGMYFVFIYTDGTMEFVPIYGNQTSLVETVYSTKEGKTLDRISASYSQFDAGGKTNRVLIYDIQLTEGNKAPTGYITAEEDVQAQIEQVKLDVDYIASDSSLTPSDKQQVANEWVRIQNEYWSIIANAAKYDVPTDTFTTYFQRLEDYLTPLLADMSTTSEITGTEFRKLFSDYYEVSSTMSDLIDDAIDESIKSTEYLKQAMEDGSTEVKGGLVMTNVMLMKNRQGEVTAGVSGLQEDNVPFWSGADYANRKKAVFRVHADGEVHATKGTIGIMQVKNDSVEVSDATASGNKIILTTNNINSVSQVLGSSEVPSSQTTESVSVITSQTKPFVSAFKTSSQFKCGAEVKMSAQVKGTIRGGGSVKIEIFNQTANTTDTIFQQSSADAGTGSIQINKNIGYRFNTPAYYYIKVSVEASSSGELGSTASAAVEAITFSFVTDVRKNLIAPNGVAVVKGSSNYAVFTGDIFEVLIGNGGLRIQNGKVYKTNSGTGGWTEI
nr:MAG TPA: Minor structural protein putative tail fiber [Caudoviricetes sp.]